MNQLSPQTQALIRTLLKIIGSALVTHGLTRAAAAVNASDTIELVFGLASAVTGYLLSRQKAAQIPVVAVPTGAVSSSGNTEYAVKPANATVTATDPTPRNITAPAIETVRISPEPVKTT